MQNDDSVDPKLMGNKEYARVLMGVDCKTFLNSCRVAESTPTVNIIVVVSCRGLVVNIMSITVNPEAQDALFEKDTVGRPSLPPNLARAALRLEFPPSYVLVGVYRLFTDKNLYGPAWDKCEHGTRRGAIVGSIWACFRLI